MTLLYARDKNRYRNISYFRRFLRKNKNNRRKRLLKPYVIASTHNTRFLPYEVICHCERKTGTPKDTFVLLGKRSMRA